MGTVGHFVDMFAHRVRKNVFTDTTGDSPRHYRDPECFSVELSGLFSYAGKYDKKFPVISDEEGTALFLLILNIVGNQAPEVISKKIRAVSSILKAGVSPWLIAIVTKHCQELELFSLPYERASKALIRSQKQVSSMDAEEVHPEILEAMFTQQIIEEAFEV